MGETGHAVVEWLQTFEAGKRCFSLVDLVDGSIIVDVLNEICPDYFDAEQLNRAANDNWALAAGNLRILLRMLDEYFETSLNKKVDTDSVDVNEIAKSANAEEIFNLIEIIIGVAVLSEHKSEFIKHVLTLPESSQVILKGFVEGALSRVVDIAGEDDEELNDIDEGEGQLTGDEVVSTGIAHSIASKSTEDKEGGNVVSPKHSSSEDELARANEMIKHLTSKQNEMLSQLEHTSHAHESLQRQYNALSARHSAQALEQDSQSHQNSFQKNSVEIMKEALVKELDEIKHDFDVQKVENEQLKAEKHQLVKSIEGSKEIIKKLEMEIQMQNDELDIQQEKLSKLNKLEASLEKYSKKLEEMQTIKKQNKELNENLDKYLDQIHDLEATNKSLTNSLKIMEMYKVKNVELDKEKIEILSKSQLMEEQYTAMQSENTRLLQRVNTQKNEIDQLNQNILTYQEEHQNNRSMSFSSPDKSHQHDFEESLGEVESVPKLKEKVKALQRTLSQYQQMNGESGNGESDVSGTAGVKDISFLVAENEELKNQKIHYEQLLIQSKKQAHSLEQEMTLLKQQIAANNINNNNDSNAKAGDEIARSAKELKDLQMKTAVHQKTIKMMEEKLQEKESAINKLIQEKNKLENYARKQLMTFKEKYMLTLQTMRAEKKELEDRINSQMMSLEKNQETWRREEKLLSSALFEIGVKIMDRKLQSRLQSSSFGADLNSIGGGNTPYLNIQREAIFQAAAGTNGTPSSVVSNTPNSAGNNGGISGRLFGTPAK